MRLSLVSSGFGLLLASVGCAASQIRTELVGTGTGVVTTRTAAGSSTDPVAAPGAGGVALPRGTYEIDLRFGIPRAQVVDWKITCPGAERSGAVGEPFETYRERRIGQLKAQWQSRKQAADAAIDAAEDAPPPTATTTTTSGPPITTRTRVRTPIGTAVVRTNVHPTTTTTSTRFVVPPPIPVVGPEPTELLPGDLGQGTVPANVRIVTTADGVCTIAAVTDDPNVRAFFSITRIRHLGVEAAERKQTAFVGAIATRGRMTAHLVARGADVDAKKRRLEAEAKLRAEADRKRAEAERQRGLELAKQRELELRVTLEARRKADDHAKAEAERRRLAEAARDEVNRKRAEAERLRGIELMKQREIELRITLEARRKAEEQRRLRLEAEARLKWEREAPLRARAELLIRQREVWLRTRVTIISWLVTQCHADPDRRGRIARLREAERLEQQRLLAIRIETERIERERLIRIKLEAERVQRERLRAERAERDRLLRIKLEAERIEREKRLAVEYLERQRLREQRDRARLERERAVAIKLEAERVRRAKEAAALAELELRRTSEALRIRSTLVGSLVAYGAKVRPPRPAPLDENPGSIPFDGAIWAAGHWEWVSLRGEWVWHGGGWRDTTRFGATGGEVIVKAPVVIDTVVAPPLVIDPGVGIDVNYNSGYGRPTVIRDRDGRRPPPRGNDNRPDRRPPATRTPPTTNGEYTRTPPRTNGEYTRTPRRPPPTTNGEYTRTPRRPPPTTNGEYTRTPPRTRPTTNGEYTRTRDVKKADSKTGHKTRR